MKERVLTLLRRLCPLFGPTGCEGEVRRAIRDELAPYLTSPMQEDALGNIWCTYGEPADGDDRILLLSAHMDEVGMMVRRIDADGMIRFGNVGGIDPRVLAGRAVTVLGHDKDKIPGVIGVTPIHLLSHDERENTPKISSLYIDIGARSREEAEQSVEVGDFVTFDSDFVLFGENDSFLRAKAIDDRLGCALMISLYRRLYEEKVKLPYRTVFSFTTREEIGLSGVVPATCFHAPTHAIILESTASGDIPTSPDRAKVAPLGHGGAISLMDNGTIYDREMVDFALSTAEKCGIPAQVKQYISGGNDSSHIQRSGDGVRCLALSAPSRYIHSAGCVAHTGDMDAMDELLYALVVGFSDANI